MSKPFIHLHLHTQYSLLDGAITIDDLVKRTQEYQMPAVAMTDHGNLYGAVEFYEKATKGGIKPILGCELYVQSYGSRFDKKIRKGFEPYHHLTVLAMNQTGYRNLCRLVTAGHLEGFYYKPRVDKELLRQHGEGLIVLSGCLSGEIAEVVLGQGLEPAGRLIEEYRQIFGDRFYLEIQENGIESQRRLNEGLAELSKKLSIPLVATNDCHYLESDQAAAHEALLCIQTGKTLQDQDRMRFDSNSFYLRSTDEIRRLFENYPGSVDQSFEIAERCHLELDFKTYHFPRFEPPAQKGLEEYLIEKASAGLEERWKIIEQKGGASRDLYETRLKRELEMIQKTGFAGYFLIVADFIQYAKEQKIPVGPGRGSATGSLVAYCLKITDLDPMPYNLLFERFLNPERISMPDMDIDFCMDRRDEVIHYVQQKYGNVAQIITFGKMKAKAVVRDVGRVMNMPYGEVDRIAKMIPNALNITLEEALKMEPRLQELTEKDPKIKKLMTIARSLEGLNRHASTHAAGVVISDRPLVEFLPLTRGQKGEVVTQYDMKAVESVGLIKFDFLGLKTLTVIDHALKIIRRTRGVELSMSEIPMDDAAVYRLLSTGNTTGIFQLESSGMRDLIVKMKPSTFPDLIALVALYRPGPMELIPDYMAAKQGRNPNYLHPALEPILKETYGIMVYQEQVMQVASALANFSLGDADILRRAMGKKKPAEMAEQKDRFIKGCLINKIPEKKAEKIFDLMAKFAAYGFNKSHSAAYGFIAYQTAYLKTHFPVEYMASLLTHEMANTDKMMTYIADCREMGIKILPPDINQSFKDFSVVGEKEIRFGLAAVKNVGIASIEVILEARKNSGPFTSFLHFCESVDLRKVNRRVIEGLIKCGAFDSLSLKRSQAWQVLDQALERGGRLQKEKISGQSSLFGNLQGGEPFPLPTIPEWSARERLASEKESLGFYITGHPLDEYEELLKRKTTRDCRTVQELKDGEEVTVGGIVAATREILTKNDERMAFITLEDHRGTVQVIVFSDLYKKGAALLKGTAPLLVKGHADRGEESVKLIARDIGPLREDSAVREVHFHLPAHQVTREHLEKLKNLLTQYRGKTPAYIHLKEAIRGETILSLPEELTVDPSPELMKEVDRLFGTPVTSLQ